MEKGIMEMGNIETSFIEVMGDYPINRVIDFLIENDRAEWSIMEIVDQTGIGYSTLKKLLPHLIEKDLIVSDRQVARSKLYRINKNSKVAKELYALHNAITNMEVERVIKI